MLRQTEGSVATLEQQGLEDVVSPHGALGSSAHDPHGGPARRGGHVAAGDA